MYWKTMWRDTVEKLVYGAKVRWLSKPLDSSIFFFLRKAHFNLFKNCPVVTGHGSG